MQLEIPQSLRTRLDLATAIEAEVAYVPPYLPPTMLIQGLEEHHEELRQLLEGQYRQGLQVEEAEVIQVSKKGTGLRPVTAVDFPSRVLYRALSSLVEQGLPELDRSFERKQELERAALADPTNIYVVLSDVAAFYDAVDHGRLVQELVAQTGEGEVAEAIAGVLGAVMGREFGLPQVLSPSDFLSEVFIDVAERDLLRTGLAVTRYNDDFWIATKTWPEAQEAIASLARAIRDLGLTLNELKTFPIRRDHYEAWLNQPEERWAEINGNVQIDLRDVGAYAEDTDMPDGLPDEEAQVAEAAVRALQLALAEQPPDALQAEVNRQLAGAAINALEFISNTAGLPYVPNVLAREPHLTARVARYLARITEAHGDDVSQVYDVVLQSETLYLSEWQAMWLFEPLRRLDQLNEAVESWATAFLSIGHGDLVRARAGLLLGEKELVEEGVLRELYGTVASSARPDVVWAIGKALSESSGLSRSVRRDSPLDRWVLEAAAA